MEGPKANGRLSGKDLASAAANVPTYRHAQVTPALQAGGDPVAE